MNKAAMICLKMSFAPELHMHKITVNFPGTVSFLFFQAKIDVPPQSPFLSPFITNGNILPVGLWKPP